MIQIPQGFSTALPTLEMFGVVALQWHLCSSKLILLVLLLNCICSKALSWLVEQQNNHPNDDEVSSS